MGLTRPQKAIGIHKFPFDRQWRPVRGYFAVCAVGTSFVRDAEIMQISNSFNEGDYVVYPTHGVGKVSAIEKQKIAGHELELFVITFDRDRMTLRVPVPKAKNSGLRKLSTPVVMDAALNTLATRGKIKRAMWSRRAQEYEAKINSGDLISIAEVVRDLHRSESQPEQSYSERQLYESALDRMAREVAAIEQIDREAAIGILHKSLQKAA